jgi:hypothetical protein
LQQRIDELEDVGVADAAIAKRADQQRINAGLTGSGETISGWLRTSTSWLDNSDLHTDSMIAKVGSVGPATNVLVDDDETCWQPVSGAEAHWLAFDLQLEYNISKFVVRHSSGPEAPKRCQLLASRETLRGPWTAVKSFECSEHPRSAGQLVQNIRFKARFWRLVVYDTYGTSLEKKYWTSRQKHGAKIQGVRFYNEVSSNAAVKVGSASSFYENDSDDDDLLSGTSAAIESTAYAPPKSIAPNDALDLFAGMNSTMERIIFNHDNLQVTMKVDAMKKNAYRLLLKASTVVGDAAEVRLMAAVPKNVSMTIGTPSGDVLATPLSEITQTIDLTSSTAPVSMRLRVVWKVGTEKKKHTVEVSVK